MLSYGKNLVKHLKLCGTPLFHIGKLDLGSAYASEFSFMLETLGKESEN